MYRREDNIRMDHKEIGCEDVAWRINFAQNRTQLLGFVNMIKNLQVPRNGGEFLDHLNKCKIVRGQFFMELVRTNVMYIP
jgi:hypothetical protein